MSKYKEYLVSLGFTNATIKTYCYIVQKFLSSGKSVQDFLSPLVDSYKNNVIKILKHYYGWVCDNDESIKNPMDKIKQVSTINKLPKFAKQDEIANIIDSIQENCFQGLRAKTMLELGISVGIRTNEFCSIKISDLDLTNKTVKLFRKGKKESIKDLTDNACEILKRYLIERDKIANCDYLFITENGDQLKSPYYVIKPYLGKLTPHQFFRHSLAISLIRNKMDIDRVQKVMDHRNISTTSVYLRAIDPDLSKELKLKHPRG